MYKPGTVLEMTKALGGVIELRQGDQLVYLGKSRARVITGPSQGWLILLAGAAPVRPIS